MVGHHVEVAERKPAGISLDAFATTDWLLLAATALMWGSSFVWIEIALESFSPTLIALSRIAFGAATLSLFPSARAGVARTDLPAIALLGLLWMAGPFLLFAFAQQWIDSSLAGMINGGVPIFAGAVAAIWLRQRPSAKTVLGIALGFTGVVAIGWPATEGSTATGLGVALVLLATVFYGIALNIAVPLQRRYGALPVLLRVQAFALLFTLLPGLAGIPSSSFDWVSLAALVPLGCLGTGLAFVAMTTLAGRVGAARGSVTIYFVPLVAIALGVVVRNETVALLSIVGTVLVLAGAYFASRNQHGR